MTRSIYFLLLGIALGVLFSYLATPVPTPSGLQDDSIQSLQDELDSLKLLKNKEAEEIIRIDTVYLTQTKEVEELTEEEAEEILGEKPTSKSILRMQIEITYLNAKVVKLGEVVGIQEEEIMKLEEMVQLSEQEIKTLEEEIRATEKKYKLQRNLAIIGGVMLIIITL